MAALTLEQIWTSIRTRYTTSEGGAEMSFPIPCQSGGIRRLALFRYFWHPASRGAVPALENAIVVWADPVTGAEQGSELWQRLEATLPPVPETLTSWKREGWKSRDHYTASSAELFTRYDRLVAAWLKNEKASASLRADAREFKRLWSICAEEPLWTAYLRIGHDFFTWIEALR